MASIFNQPLRFATRRTLTSFITTPVARKSTISAISARNLSSTARVLKPEEEHKAHTTATGEPAGEHEGLHARTDGTFTFEHPEEQDMPKSTPIQGRGGMHFKRTLASFSLEGKVGVVTGGARGLGLVMSQALHSSGAQVAIVDLNSMFHLGPSQARIREI